MAKKQDQYDSALGSIFDFIFTSAKTRPPKVKPVRYTGLKGTTEMASSLAEIASKPYLYASDAAYSAFNDMLGQSLIEFSVDKFDPSVLKNLDNTAGRFRVRNREIGKLISNPRKYIDSVFEGAKAERAWARYINVARGVDAGMLGIWAKRTGMSTKDAFDLGNAAGHWVTLDMQNNAQKMQMENAAMQVVKSAYSSDLALKARDAISEARTVKYDQASLRKILGPKLGITGQPLDLLVNDILSQSNGTLRPRYYTKDNLSESRLNAMGYRSIYSENLLLRFSNLDPNSAATPAERTKILEQKRSLQKAKAAVDAINRVKRTNYSVGLPNFVGSVKDIDDEINRINALGPLSTTDAKYVSRLQGYKNNILSVVAGESDRLQKAYNRRFWGFERESDFRQVKKGLESAIDAEIEKWRYDLKVQLNANNTSKAQLAFANIRVLQLEKRAMQTLPGKDWRVRIANWVGAYRSIDGNIVKGGLVGGLITGALFNTDGFINPASVDRYAVSFLKKIKVNGVDQVRTEKILVPRNDVNGHYASLTGLYYFTPASIIKTFLFNGEGFVYGMYSQRRGLEKFFSRPDVVAKLQASGLMGQLSGFYQGNNANFMDADKFDNFMNILANSNSPFAKLGKRSIRASAGLERLATAFSYPSRLMNAMMNRFVEPVGLRLRGFFGKFLKGLSKNAEWHGSVDDFIAKTIGIQQLITVGVERLLTSMGVAVGGPVGGIIAGIISDLVAKAAYKVAKPMVEFLALGCLGFLGFLIFALFFGFSNLTALGRHIVPGTCEECLDENPHSGLYPEPPIEIPGTEYPPIDSQCPLNYSPLVCTQGTHGNVSTYHQRTKAIDVRSWNVPEGEDAWYAPTNGSIISYSPSNICADGKDYGGTMKFVDSGGNVYVLLHIRALKSGGKVNKGTAIAITRRDLATSDCWTGPHHHLEVISNGGYQDAYDWYVNKLKCGVSACQ